MQVAGVGTGIAGNAAAYALADRHHITVYERELKPGGHSHTLDIDYDGSRIAVDTGIQGSTVANQTARIADLNLLQVGSGYSLLAKDVQAAAEAIAAGQEPTWERSAGISWIADIYLQPRSDGTLTAAMLPGTHALMCFPVGEHDESLGVYLTLPFEVVVPEGP